MYFARLSENIMSVCDKYFHFVFNITGNTSSDFLQKLQVSGEVFLPPEPSRAKFTPSGRVLRLSCPLDWTLFCLSFVGILYFFMPIFIGGLMSVYQKKTNKKNYCTLKKSI